MDRSGLERLDRESLVIRAQAAGIKRARVLTRPELVDELLRLDPEIDPAQLKRTRGFFGRARDLLSRVVERGLHLPDAADRLRDALVPLPQVPRPEPQAVPTVTLAEIYAAQGHKQRAIDTLKRVIEQEPEHAAARALLDTLEAADYVAPEPPLPPEADERPAEHEEETAAEDGARRAAASAPPASEPIPPTPRLEEPPTLAEGAPPPPVASGSAPPVAAPEVSVVAHLERRSECVAVPLDPGAWYVWWRLSADAERALAGRGLVVRCLVVEPSWDGPSQRLHDVEVAAELGEHTVRDLPERAIVRVAVGFVEEAGRTEPQSTRSDEGRAGRFVPLAHSPAIEASASGAFVEWTVGGVSPIAPGDPRAAAIARAAEGAAAILR